MSTRARTRTTAAAVTTATAAKSASTAAKSASKSAPKFTAKAKKSENVENDRPKSKAAPKGRSKSKSQSEKEDKEEEADGNVYCVCRNGDDGSPMVNCGECDEWCVFSSIPAIRSASFSLRFRFVATHNLLFRYHFNCVSLSEQTAEDINVYICPSCTSKTGQRTVMLWEGSEALEDAGTVVVQVNGATPAPPPAPKVPKKESKPASEPEHESGEDDGGASSEDEYVADRNKRRRARRLSFSSESGSEASGPASARKDRGSKKRKAAERPTHLPAPKRKKASAAAGAAGEPARAFCLGKLEGVFREIFLRYPHVESVAKSADALSEDERSKVEEDAKRFAADLEQCVYDIYAEPDGAGKMSAGAKYKDRFRMLQFNLREKDRTQLHQGIASGAISPKALSLMSPADLANEQTKSAIKQAEEEALAHSILEKPAVPRAKLTHKGLEDIEGDAYADTGSPREREREQEEREREEERRAREREERLRTRARTTSVSVPPESPLTPGPGGSSWGAPPRVPPTPTEASSTFAPETEPEMNLADLINIDDELGASEPTPGLSSPVDHKAPSPPTPGALPTGISPFASKPEATRGASFDLNALWAGPKKEEAAEGPVKADAKAEASEEVEPMEQRNSPVPMPMEEEPQDGRDEAMDMDVEGADDMDFDVFLDEKDGDAVAPTPESLQATFNALPQVWAGKINMPLDSTIPQETPVVARQIGGRSLEMGSVLWKTLFPSELLRIDGRVPVDKSAQFLLQTRMNSTKELIAVAFSPRFDGANAGFQILTDFLIAKGRHGLVFPWGRQPKDFHPGKELYIIPLLSSDPLPDYMELLDNLHLPKIRSVNYLVGVWVLNKGKLAPPPTPAPGPSVVPQQPQPYNVPAPGPVQPLTFEPSVLAAEVAALTPEQVRLMLQSLTASTLNVLPIPAPPPAPVPVPVPVHAPMPPQPQAWGHQPMPMPAPSMPMTYGAPPPHTGPPPPLGHPGLPPHNAPYGQHQQPYDRRDYNRDGGGYDRGGRDGWNSRGRGRGRGRGAAGGGGGDRPLPSDSGWPRRRDSGQGSPVQRRWN
ncbi:hypothetical protein DFH07DRAFT_1058909 [Mycena maculata]|uniref:Transcription factor BYE1 n=1 Tax=Mycena maculata TaxID=230809 RepID=A0AAD7NKF7_9AGAR|nr:hypothetical protein DFH07DRAFT_1058909 [Mycena maculata]